MWKKKRKNDWRRKLWFREGYKLAENKATANSVRVG